MKTQAHGENRRAAVAAGAVFVCLIPLLAWIGEARAASLLDPTPQGAMRPLSTDRPDVTESPYTVDAGHLQVELDVFTFSRHEDGGLRREELRLAQTNLKLGLGNRVELQLVLAPYVKSSLEFAGVDFDVIGNDDLTLRLKVNVTGNGGDGVALALLPFVTPPTSADGASDREPAYGVAIPVALALPHAFGLGLMAQVQAQDEDRAYLMSASVSRALGASVGAFLEVAAERIDRPDMDPLFSPLGPTDFWISTLDTGFTVGVTPDLQLDAALLLGLTDEAPDWTTYAGITVRR